MDEDSNKKVIDIKQARRRQGASTLGGRRAGGSSGQGPKKGQKGSPGSSGPKIAGYSLLHWLQFFLFLLVFSYFIKTCSGG